MRNRLSFGPVLAQDMQEWCRLLKDGNAIHLSRESAEAVGFGPRRVNPGPANLAYVISALMAGSSEKEFAEITAVFSGNVFEDDLLRISLNDDGSASLHAGDGQPPVLTVAVKEKP